MCKMKHAIPVLLVVSLPLVLLVSKSPIALQAVFCAAMFLVAAIGGEELVRLLPRIAALVLSIASLIAIVAVVAVGWISVGGSSPYHFGSLALIVVATVMPIRAMTVLMWPEKALTKD